MIALTEEGPALPHYRGSDHLHGAQDILVLNPGEVHGGGPAQGAIWRYRAFYLPSVLLQRVAQEVFGIDRGLPQFAEDVISDPFVREMLLQAHAALGESSSIMERESRLLDALASLVVRHSVNKQPPHRIGTEHLAVKRAIEFLEITPNENISLEQLAQEVGLSPFHLCRVFHQATGLSPHAYQTLLRVRLAKTLLAKGHQISQVAVDAGFFDQAHLTRHFKRIFGVSPGKYIGNVLPPHVKS